MARDVIPKEAHELARYMKRLMAGDDIHKSKRPVRESVRADLERARDELLQAAQDVQDAEATLKIARDRQRKVKEDARERTRRMRDGIYAVWGYTSSALYDYGLKPDERGRPKGSEGT